MREDKVLIEGRRATRVLMCATCLACGGLHGERVRVFLEPSCCLDTCVRGRTDLARVAAAGIIGARGGQRPRHALNRASCRNRLGPLSPVQ